MKTTTPQPIGSDLRELMHNPAFQSAGRPLKIDELARNINVDAKDLEHLKSMLKQ